MGHQGVLVCTPYSTRMCGPLQMSILGQASGTKAEMAQICAKAQNLLGKAGHAPGLEHEVMVGQRHGERGPLGRRHQGRGAREGSP